MASSEETSVQQGNGGSNSRQLAEVDEMRLQIKKLQEKKVEAMKSEVVELQKERDMLLGRNKILNQTLQDLSLELESLKKAKKNLSLELESVNKAKSNAISKVSQLERKIIEENMASSELKRKLQLANKQTAHLKSEIKNLKSRLENSGSLLQVSLDVDSSLERSRSMDDMGEEIDKEGANNDQDKRDTLQTQHPPQKSKRDLSLRAPNEMTSPLVQSQRAAEVPSPKTSTPTSTVAPKRYILATEKPKDVGVQTETQPEEPTMKITEVETMKAKHEDEKKSLEKNIKRLQLEAKRDKEYRAKVEKRVKDVQVEHDVLKTGLDAFNTWTRQKLQSIEEDIDICRVVYSLHGSMSQEAQLIKDLQEKLSISEQKQHDAEALNKYLNSNIETLEEQVKHTKRRNDLLKEKILLLTPVKSNKQSYPTKMSSPISLQPGTPQTLRPPGSQQSRQRLASTPQTVRSALVDPSPLVRDNKTPTSIVLSPQKSGNDAVLLKKREQSPVGSVGSKGRQTRQDNMKEKRRLSGGKERISKEKLIKNGDSWYSVPDDDDDDSEV